MVLEAHKTTVRRFIARHASGNQPHSGPFVDALVEGLRQAAREARDRHRGHVDFAELQAEIAIEIPIEIPIEIDVMNAHMAARAELDRKIEVLYAELQPEHVRHAIPGVGRHSAPVLFGVLHSADRFRSERHTAASAACFAAARTAAAQQDRGRG